jgi:hypothetical protein
MSPAFRASRDVGVIVAHEGDPVYVALLPAGPLLVLEGVAATIWTEATTDPAQGWVARVASAFEATETQVAPDVRRFVADLEARGILEAVEDVPVEDVPVEDSQG